MKSVDNAVKFIREGLKKYYGTKKIQMNWYFNNTSLEIRGVSSKQHKILSKEFVAEFGKDPGQDFIHKVSLSLWKSTIFEEKGKAIGLICLYPRYFDDATWKIAEKYLAELDNWAFHDEIATGIFGELILLDMGRFKRLSKWTKSANFWERRSSAVATIPLNQSGNVNPKLSFKMCKPLMVDGEIMVQKGVSWTIRTASKHDPDGAFELLTQSKGKTSRWILRDGSGKLSDWMRKIILAK